MRRFDSFRAAAHEAGISRVYGGIHFPTGNVGGRALGECIGAKVVERFKVAREHDSPHSGVGGLSPRTDRRRLRGRHRSPPNGIRKPDIAGESSSVPSRHARLHAHVGEARLEFNFQNFVSDTALLGNRILGQGAGVALGDVDGDGLVDVFLATHRGMQRALSQSWQLAISRTSRKSAGVGACDRHSTGAAFADVDGDGDLDLVLLATKGPNAIFVNDGQGHFTEHRDLGLDSVGKGGTTITMADVDGDGRLDLYVANYKPYSIDDSLPPQQRAFNQMVRQVGPEQVRDRPRVRATSTRSSCVPTWAVCA